jgi:hypothetical protein
VSDDGHQPRPILNGVLLIALLGLLVSAWLITTLAGSEFFTYDDVGTGPIGLRQKAMSAAIGFVLLSLAAVAMRELGAARWLITLTAAAGVGCALVSVRYLMSSPDGPDVYEGNPWWWVIRAWAIIPTTWPIVIVFVGSLLVRGWSIWQGRGRPSR